MSTFDESKISLFNVGYDCARIEEAARGLTRKDVLAFFGYAEEELNEDERAFFSHHYLIGRATGKNLAVDHLFKQMGQKGGAQASISYLVRFADNWEEKLEADGDAKRKFVISID